MPDFIATRIPTKLSKPITYLIKIADPNTQKKTETDAYFYYNINELRVPKNFQALFASQKIVSITIRNPTTRQEYLFALDLAQLRKDKLYKELDYHGSLILPYKRITDLFAQNPAISSKATNVPVTLTRTSGQCQSY